MFARRSRRLLTTWLALWALLGGALAPLVTHALQREAGTGWLEVCTVRGAVRVAGGGTPLPANDGASLAHAMEQCALCLLLHHPGWVPPPALPAAPAGPVLSEAVAAPSQALPRPHEVWTRAPSRAPPFDA